MKFIRLTILLCIGPGMISSLCAQWPVRLDRPQTVHGFCSIHYPKDFDAAKAYHVLYWFHGTSGRPNPGIGRDHRSYISVGMSYRKREHVPPGEYGASHWVDCLAVRRELEEAGLNLRRNVVAGMSKGGWAGFYIGAERPEGPDAIAIFAAGKDPRWGEAEPLRKSPAILVGTGETDPNYPQAQLAVEFFRQAGSQVNYEEWLGKGHTFAASPRVLAWLEVESLKDRPDELHRYATRHLQTEMARCEEISDPLDRYVALRFLLGHPTTPHAPEFLHEQLLEAGRAAGKAPEITQWLDAHKQLQALVTREAHFFDSRSFDVEQLGQLVERFRALTESAPDPSLAARAAYGARRAKKMHAIYHAQQKAKARPEYVAMRSRYTELQRLYSDADGNPGDAVLAELNEVGAKLSDLRFDSSMKAFTDEEWGNEPEPDAQLDAAIDADSVDGLRPYVGLGF
jgi:hypothetical protein